MELDNRSIDLEVDEDFNIRCKPCNKLLKPNYIAMLSRSKPGGSFQPMCRDCFQTVVRAALKTCELEMALETLFT